MSVEPRSEEKSPFEAVVIRSLFVHRDALTRHLTAPNLKGRELYLLGLLSNGFKRKDVAERASLVLAIEKRVQRSPEGFVTEEAILKAAQIWCRDHASTKGKGFVAAARSWSRFLGIWPAPAARGGAFAEAFHLFACTQKSKDHLSPVSSFLEEISCKRQRLSSIAHSDVVTYLKRRKGTGWSPRTVHNAASALRSFFRFVEAKGMMESNLSRAIQVPCVRKRSNTARGPAWKEVLALLSSFDPSIPSHCRARAILLLAAVYGLRRSELVKLTLDDFDWKNKVFTVRRAKRGRIQRFPLSKEVEMALRRYVAEVRPRTETRLLFLTLQKPYRPAVNLGPSMRKIMSNQRVFDRAWGLHALRHACATELLRQGTSLRGIASYLGHTSLHAVSIYAHCEQAALERVADLDLSCVL